MAESNTIGKDVKFVAESWLGPAATTLIFLVMIGFNVHASLRTNYFGVFALLGCVAAIAVLHLSGRKTLYLLKASGDLSLRDDCIVVKQSGNETSIQLSEITAFGFGIEEADVTSEVTGNYQSISIWTAPPDKMSPVVALRGLFPQDSAEAGQFAGLKKKLLELISKGSVVGFARDGFVKGCHFSFDGQSISYGGKKYSINDIVYYESTDEKIRIWTANQPQAVIELAIDEPNGLALLLALSMKVRRREAKEGLGRMLFERRSVLGHTLLLWFAVIVMAWVVYRTWGRYDGHFRLLPIGSFGSNVVLFVGLLGLVLWMTFNRFRCYERGASRRTVFGTKTIFYENLESFCFAARNNLENQAHISTTVKLGFTVKAEFGGTSISYSRKAVNLDRGLLKVRELASAPIVTQWRKQLATGKEVPWQEDVSFSSKGLTCQIYRYGAEPEKRNVAYEKIERHTCKEGVFGLYVEKEESPFLEVLTDSPNFYPGLSILTEQVPNKLREELLEVTEQDISFSVNKSDLLHSICHILDESAK